MNTETENGIIEMFLEGETFTSIGEKYGISGEWARQVCQRRGLHEPGVTRHTADDTILRAREELKAKLGHVPQISHVAAMAGCKRATAMSCYLRHGLEPKEFMRWRRMDMIKRLAAILARKDAGESFESLAAEYGYKNGRAISSALKQAKNQGLYDRILLEMGQQ